MTTHFFASLIFFYEPISIFIVIQPLQDLSISSL